MVKRVYRSSRNVVSSAKYHLVWCHKYRRRVLAGVVETRLCEIIRQVCAGHDAEIIGLEVMADHVHLLAEVDPSFGIARLVRLMKGRSSRILRAEFPHLRRLPTLWSIGLRIASPLAKKTVSANRSKDSSRSAPRLCPGPPVSTPGDCRQGPCERRHPAAGQPSRPLIGRIGE